LFRAAVETVIESGRGSVNHLRKSLEVGTRTARELIDRLEREGVVGGPAGSRPRAVLLTRDEWLDREREDV